MARESSLWKWLAKARLELEDALHFQRIENAIAAGFPDVEGYLTTNDASGAFVIELKSQDRPARSSTPVRFKLKGRDKQIEFMETRWRLGGNAFWLLQVGSGPERRLYLAPGDLGPRLKTGLTESELAVECVTGSGMVFPKTVRPRDILESVITCRKRPSSHLRVSLTSDSCKSTMSLHPPGEPPRFAVGATHVVGLSKRSPSSARSKC